MPIQKDLLWSIVYPSSVPHTLWLSECLTHGQYLKTRERESADVCKVNKSIFKASFDAQLRSGIKHF